MGDLKVGMLGLGAMGQGIAANIVAAGYPLTIMANVNRNPIDELVRHGAEEVTTIAELVDASDVLLLCVSNAEVALALTKEMALKPDQILLDLGTPELSSMKSQQEYTDQANAKFLIAPLAGGAQQASEGTLGAFLGGCNEAKLVVKRLLNCFCASVRDFGTAEQAAAAKLINNHLVFGMAALVIESFELADKAGLNRADLFETASKGAGDSMVLHRIVGQSIKGDNGGYVFPVGGAKKDLDYFKSVAHSLEYHSPLSEAIISYFEQAVLNGKGDQRISALLKPMR